MFSFLVILSFELRPLALARQVFSHLSHTPSLSQSHLLRRSQIRGWLALGKNSNSEPYLKNKIKRTLGIVQGAECLPTKFEFLNSNPNTTKKEK
jgi:hypothetical protein